VIDDPDLTAAYRFELPANLIAQEPAARRDASRLMVVRDDGVEHKRFFELGSVLRAGDLLILNQTRVIPARLHGRRAAGGRAEVLLLRPADRPRYDTSATRWLGLVKPGRRLPAGGEIFFDGAARAVVIGVRDDGVRELEFEFFVAFEEFLERYGSMPLPPYIHNDGADAQARYQTVFATVPGSVAAPTASLHFTPELLDELRQKEIQIETLVLDVGLGTFRPMQAQRLDDHTMHAETYAISERTAGAIERARREGRRVVAAGTTVVRALEGSARANGRVVADSASTDLFIRPGFPFAVVDAMITNFHLPESTLLVLVSAFAGRERVLDAYRQAVNAGYRFFSFGDAMFVERGARA